MRRLKKSPHLQLGVYQTLINNNDEQIQTLGANIIHLGGEEKTQTPKQPVINFEKFKKNTKMPV